MNKEEEKYIIHTLAAILEQIISVNKDLGKITVRGFFEDTTPLQPLPLSEFLQKIKKFSENLEIS